MSSLFNLHEAIDNRPATRRWPVALIVAVLIFLASEGAARALAPRLPDPDQWGAADLDQSFEAMRALNNAGESVDVVFLGSSAVKLGLNVRVVEARADTAAFNASFNGATPRTVELWAEEVVLPLLSPEVVVIPLTSRAFNEHGLNGLDINIRYLNSDGRARHLGTESVVDRAEAHLERISAFVRLRSVLRQPDLVAKSLTGRGERESEAIDGGLTPPYSVTQDFRNKMTERVLNDYEVGPTETDALDRLIGHLLDAGIRVVLVDMPTVEADLTPLHPHGAADLDRYRVRLRDIAIKWDVPLIDGSSAHLDVEHFVDPIHLNELGRDRFSRWLTDELAQRGLLAPLRP